MKKLGNKNPNATPKACDATAILRAITLSLGPNQSLAILAGAFNMKGYPTAANTCPAMQALNPHTLIKDFKIIPRVVRKVPSSTPFRLPYTSIT